MTIFKAQKVQQNDWVFYVFVIKSDLLNKIAYVSKRFENKEEGYQRNLTKKRGIEIHDYIFKLKGVIPNNIILNFDVGLNYDEKNHTVSFDVKDNIAWVVDGQHRLYGLSLSRKSIDVVVVAFEKLPLSDQTKIFRTINSTQKGVNASLIYDLMDLAKDADYIDQRAHELVKKLNEDEESPWYNQIKMLGVGHGLISQSAFIGNLKPLLDKTKVGHLTNYSEEEQYKILKNYFNAIRAIFPDDWGKSNSLLTKTSGFYALMELLPTIMNLCLQINPDLTTNAIINALQPIRHYDFSSAGALKGVSGKHGVQRIVSELGELLRSSRITKQTSTIKL